MRLFRSHSALDPSAAGTSRRRPPRGASDPTIPPQGFFYLITSRNRLDEEGIKGHASSGVERANPLPCP
ncbi:MAG: hypothetical protein DMF52_16120 [Acidobacteria bacterium]|nr:MAG: hypothetical protein DMF52_16120 [Acidobacteriota bacterium]